MGKYARQHIGFHRRVLFNYFGNQCNYCGSSLKLQLHHIVPKKMGGSDTLGNLELVCHICHMDLHNQLRKMHVPNQKRSGDLEGVASNWGVTYE